MNEPMGRKTTSQESYVVPQHLINQVRLKYITETVKQVQEFILIELIIYSCIGCSELRIQGLELEPK